VTKRLFWEDPYAKRFEARVLEVRLPGALGAAMAKGGLLPGSDARLGSQTFAQWLDQYRGTGGADDR